MYVPSGLCAGLKDQQGLERIARSIHVQDYMFIGAVALRLRDNLQRGYLAVQVAQAHEANRKHRRRPGYAEPE
jgi:hypothetical protein